VRPIAVACGLVVVSAASVARADGFEYVDRDGRAHAVRPAASADGSPPEATPRSRPGSGEAGDLPSAAPLPYQPSPGIGPEDDAFPYATFITQAAGLYSLPRELVCAVMKIESGGNPNAVSSSGALGLMQLMPSTAADLQLTDPFDPRQNVFGGVRFLRILVNTFQGDLALALAAYHAGAGRVQRWGGVPDIPATRRYVANVMATYHRFEIAAAHTRLVALSARGGQ
jgi:soluble lytic murein transglycosylase-like protein